MNRLLLSGSLLVLLAGCAQPVVTPVATESDVVSVRIAQAAEKAAAALDSLSSVEQVRTPIPATPDYTGAPPSLMEPVTVTWSGPIEQITGTLATRAGYKLLVKGNKPPVPVTVVLNANQTPLIEVLKDVGLQAGKRAALTVDSKTSSIELSFAPVDKL